jgi:hypothetical protein
MTTNGHKPETMIVRGSEVYERVVVPIFEHRNAEKLAAYEAELKQYLRRLGKREEKTYKIGDTFDSRKALGFQVPYMGQTVTVLRPEKPRPLVWGYMHYERFMGSAMHANQLGLLANSPTNRPILPRRVEAYQDAMQKGEWRDLLSDPLTLTEEGYVVNGQHRIAAACRVDWTKAPNDPAFLVVCGVSPEEAALTDNNKRSAADTKIIAQKLLVHA